MLWNLKSKFGDRVVCPAETLGSGKTDNVQTDQQMQADADGLLMQSATICRRYAERICRSSETERDDDEINKASNARCHNTGKIQVGQVEGGQLLG